MKAGLQRSSDAAELSQLLLRCSSSENIDIDVCGRREPAVNQDVELCVTGSNQLNTDANKTRDEEPADVEWSGVHDNVQVHLKDI